MKIEGSSIQPVSNVQMTNRITKNENERLTWETDRMAMSDKGQLYQSLYQKALDTPSVREDLVGQLKEQIANGEYKVDSQKVAGKMLDFQI